MDLIDNVIVVTGGARGIGAALARGYNGERLRDAGVPGPPDLRCSPGIATTMDVHVATVRARSWSGNVPAPGQPLQGRSGHIVSAAAAVDHPAVGAVTESGKILEPGEVVDAVVANLAEGSISISPHHDVGALATTKAADPDAWLQRQGLPPGRG